MAKQSKLNQFLDRYIQGERGSYFFNIELIWGRTISGGQFRLRSGARENLLLKLTNFLDDPSALLHTKHEAKHEVKQ
jgi:hypothetical protein